MARPRAASRSAAPARPADLPVAPDEASDAEDPSGTPADGPRPPAGVLERGLSILEAFDEAHLRLTLRDFAERTGLDKATLLRLLAVLAKSRLVQRSDGGVYSPGPALFTLGMLYRRAHGLGERLQPVLRAVMEQTGETVAFYVRSGDERVCLYRENTLKEVRHHVEPGTRVPLKNGGASAHILQFYGGGETPHAAAIARDHHVITRAERVPEMSSIALPVFDGEGSFLGSLVVMGLASRQTVAQQIKGAELAREQLALQGFLSRPPAGWTPPAH